jgi:hypothetical protein
MTAVVIIVVAFALAVMTHGRGRRARPPRIITIEITITTRSDGIGSGRDPIGSSPMRSDGRPRSPVIDAGANPTDRRLPNHHTTPMPVRGLAGIFPRKSNDFNAVK